MKCCAQAGTPVTLVYDGTGQPSMREFKAVGLTSGQTYAYKVAALSSAHPEGGMGIPSVASITVTARTGADPSHTSAVGSPLHTATAGFVHEVQYVEVTAASGLGGHYRLAFPGGAPTALISASATAAQLKSALEGLTMGATGADVLGPVVIDTAPLRDPSLVGTLFRITFASNFGDVPNLIVSDVTVLTGASATVDAVEFRRGSANSFVIEPRKVCACGDVQGPLPFHPAARQGPRKLSCVPAPVISFCVHVCLRLRLCLCLCLHAFATGGRPTARC